MNDLKKSEIKSLNKQVEKDEDAVEEAASMAGSYVQGSPAAGGGAFQHMDVEKENEEEKKRSQSVIKKALVGEKAKNDPIDQYVEEIVNYLSVKDTFLGE